MEIDTHYLTHDRKRKLKIKHAAMWLKLKTKTTDFLMATVLLTLAIQLFYYPVFKSVFAVSETLVEEDAEPAIPEPVTVPAQPIPVLIKVKTDWTQERIKQEIARVFPDAPIMQKVAMCEGTKNGLLYPNAHNPMNGSGDSGIMQISEKYHGKEYRRLGFTDMNDVKQNLAYARVLYDLNGLEDWRHSRHCWSK